MPIQTFLTTLTQGNDVLSRGVSVSGDAKDIREVTIPPSGTTSVGVAFRPQDLKSFGVLSDIALSMATVTSGTSVTSHLPANTPMAWHSDMTRMGLPCPWHNATSGVMITGLDFTSAGNGATANVKIQVMHDSTP